MDTKLAVLICLYAGDQKVWFQQAVDSIIHQTVGSERIHIYLGIDGPLSRDMEGYLAAHKDLFYKIAHNPRNEGLTRTLNCLIEMLEDEEFIFRLDADDFCSPDRFEKQIRFMRQHPDVELLGSSVVEVDSHGEQIFQRDYPRSNDEIRRKISRANPVAHSSVCFRRSFFDKIGRYPDRVTYNQDLALWFEGLKRGIHFANLAEPLVYMRVNHDFYQRRSRKRAFDEVKIYFKGIYELNGLTFRFIFPVARFLFRLLPVPVIRFFYTSAVRKKLA